MRNSNTTLYVCAALFVCWPALAFTQLVPDPGAPPQSNSAPVAQTPGDGQGPGATSEQAPASGPATPADTTPDSQPPLPPPGPPIADFQKLIAPDQLAFLKDYDGRMPKEIMKDKRFRQLEKQILPDARYFYHYDKPLSEARDEVMDNDPLPITVRDGRYVMVASAGGGDQHMLGRGFMWFDMQSGIGLGGIYFHPTNGEPSPTLAIYSKQLTDTVLSMGQLPDAFLDDFWTWANAAQVHYVSPRYFIPSDDRKYVLIHDEDYCAHGDDERRPDDCEEMNADAADIDMEAAYFMQETGNATDATAYMLNQDQIDWLAVRDRECGPNGLECRIRVTRRRTAAIIGHPLPPTRVGRHY
jgi:uncharacterized protein YecT (DUF1311 family)